VYGICTQTANKWPVLNTVTLGLLSICPGLDATEFLTIIGPVVWFGPTFFCDAAMKILRSLSLVPFFASLVFGLSPTGTDNGIFHLKIGEIDFYVLEDASSTMGNNLMITDDKEALKQLAPTGQSPSSVCVFAVKKGSEVFLIDTGFGKKTFEQLQTLGIKPEEVKNILLTHSHGDHVGGLVKGGKKAFPNAVIWLDARELDFWKTGKSKDSLEQCLKLYGEPKFLTPDEKSSVIFPEIVAVDLTGHTPGHLGFLISSDEKKLIVVGDMLHNGAVQFSRPDISIQYDNDPKKAAEVRQKTMKRAAEENWLFAAVHLPFPSIGDVKTNNGFRFESVEK